ncbi:Uncharacterized membrane-anchored protein [Jatrophihabitans endophyticus]|uniref:Uncharacterized membrane-anchored protein n=1 Tax=Jatrophihabitans endophyticus TaxID=1206085 RepID=A0A1M5MPT9_9ACTN|nr:putative cytokinetic ring protein SteA [Jatrophihabitans endophyticus]SHG79217.1 Uncharacterized membrane-anchored protein [Jatrophihabitans endophyticus]
MKLATLRRRAETLPGVSGVARLDRATTRLAGRLNPGDVAIIDHVDLDRATAETLLAARPAAIVNAQPCISGRYPNLGPELVVAHGVPLLDNVGGEVFAAVKEGAKVRVDGDTVYVGETPIASGTVQDADTVETLMAEAKAGLASQLEAFAVNTGEFMTGERRLLLEGEGIPALTTRMRGKHVLVVMRSHEYASDLKALKSYIREYRPVLVGVDGGADALIEAGHTPDLIVGDMDAVSDTALATGAEVVVHAYPDGRAPGLLRVQDLGVPAVTFPTAGTSEDVALLLADEGEAELIVAVGSHADLTEFLDRGRAGMASSFLVRLKIGAKLVDAATVTRLYRNRISAAALLLLVIGALVAVAAALAVSDAGRTYLTTLSDDVGRFFDWLQDSFS